MSDFDEKNKRFRIPNRDVKLTELEAEITRTRVFQRLFYLKQLGLAHLVYPSATHTRAGHSIECLDEASRLLDAIGVEAGSNDWSDVRMAALLHDMGHVPFSHTLEDENEVLPKHDKGERVSNVLEKLKGEVGDDAQALIDRAAPILHAISSSNDSVRDWKSDLVGNTVCADLLAYITTDAAWTGIEKRPGYYRIYDYFTRAEKTVRDDDGTEGTNERLCIKLTKGGLRTDIVSAIMDLLDMRYALTERVIYHHAKAIASAMLARAARLANLEDEPKLLDMGDEAFLLYLESLAANSPDKPTGDGAKMLLDRLRSRNLYKRIFKIQRQDMESWNRRNSQSDDDKFDVKWRNSEAIEELLVKIEDRLDLQRGSLVLWCPEGKSGMKLVKANVIWQQSGGWHKPVVLRSQEVRDQFRRVYDRVETIENQYLDLWTFWIGINPEQMEKAPAVIDALARELGIDCDPVFIETYAKQNPRFKEAAEIYEKVNGAWRTRYAPDVSRRVTEMTEEDAALEGGSFDESLIDEAISEAASEKSSPVKKSKVKNSKDQLELDGTKAEEQSEENE
ncbi:MAG: HD domain-containing protein [Actinobacteria bacterium]|nr:HD domain-containing protein [Actinomycetota bacterium]